MVLENATWADYLRHLEMRGDKCGPRIAYADGLLEIVSPAYTHERVKSNIGRLVGTWAMECGVDLSPLGNWTLKDEAAQRGLEPDECYVLGAPSEEPTRPELAIEVIWTSGGIDKLAIYETLGIREVWFWQDDALRLFELRDDAYVAISESGVLAGLDLKLLLSFLHVMPTTREYRAALGAVR